MLPVRINTEGAHLYRSPTITVFVKMICSANAILKVSTFRFPTLKIRNEVRICREVQRKFRFEMNS